MALYEYHCESCGARFDKRMPMSDVLQLVPCTNCSATAKKVMGNFAIVGADKGGGFDGLSWDNAGMGMEGGEHDHEFGGGDDFGDDDF